MLTDSRGTSRWRHRYWHRANLMPRADRDRYGGSVTAIPATSPWSLRRNTLPSLRVSPLVSRLGWLIGPLRLHHRSHPLWFSAGVSLSLRPCAVTNPLSLYFRSLPAMSPLFSSPGRASMSTELAEGEKGYEGREGGRRQRTKGVRGGEGGQRTGIEFEVTSIRKRVIDMSKAGWTWSW